MDVDRSQTSPSSATNAQARANARAAPATVSESALRAVVTALTTMNARDSSSIDDEKGKLSELALVGEGIGGRAAERASRGLAPCASEHDAVVRACKELWMFLHGKRIDKLKTNNKGVFVLHDDAFVAMRAVGGTGNESSDERIVARALALHAGALRGALRAFGVECDVVGEISRSTSTQGVVSGARAAPALRAPAPAVAFSVTLARARA